MVGVLCRDRASYNGSSYELKLKYLRIRHSRVSWLEDGFEFQLQMAGIAVVGRTWWKGVASCLSKREEELSGQEPSKPLYTVCRQDL